MSHESHWGEHSNRFMNRFMNRRVELGNDKEITTTLTVPGTITTAVGRQIWSKISRKICMKKPVDKCGCLKHCALFDWKPVQFLKHRSYAVVLWCIYWCLIQFWLHYILLKSELQ